MIANVDRLVRVGYQHERADRRVRLQRRGSAGNAQRHRLVALVGDPQRDQATFAELRHVAVFIIDIVYN